MKESRRLAQRIKKQFIFEIGKPAIHFHCDWGIYPKGLDSSICYCTDEARAELVCAALNAWLESSKGKKWWKENIKR